VCPGELYMISIVCLFGVRASLVSFKCPDPSDIHYENFMAPPGEKITREGVRQKGQKQKFSGDPSQCK
jgi:hypothetical protein